MQRGQAHYAVLSLGTRSPRRCLNTRDGLERTRIHSPFFRLEVLIVAWQTSNLPTFRLAIHPPPLYSSLLGKRTAVTTKLSFKEFIKVSTKRLLALVAMHSRADSLATEGVVGGTAAPPA